MPVEIFTKSEFEAALPVKVNSTEPAWKCLGLLEGEYAYLIPVSTKNNVGIHVRSSVKSDGRSADCGEDSIRAWIVDLDTGKPLGGKISRWTTRQPGWAKRLWNPNAEKEKDKGVLWALREMARKVVPCPRCGLERVRVFKVKKEGENHGRPFRTCSARQEGQAPDEKGGCGFFEWLDEENGQPTKTEKPAAAPRPADNVVADPCPQCAGKVMLLQVKKDGPNKGKWFHTCHGSETTDGGCGYFKWVANEPAPAPKPETMPVYILKRDDKRLHLTDKLDDTLWSIIAHVMEQDGGTVTLTQETWTKERYVEYLAVQH